MRWCETKYACDMVLVGFAQSVRLRCPCVMAGVITIFTPPDLLVVLFYYCSGVLMAWRGYTDFTAHYIVHPAWRAPSELVDLFLVT